MMHVAWLPRESWTREIDFGITVNCRRVRNCKVTALRHETGTNVHAVRDAILEWVPGAPKMQIRYILACGSNGRQARAQVMKGDPYITCGRCREAIARERTQADD